ncbi:flavin-containing monooxygenase [Aureimonas pseudogalii]|uniref:Cation diffusion facilitator CzcD-associated flavoprotein CzcO n=1 Tax=Aureimonas pseudogalii TaxID=1744844 RepID=A0A7W6EAH5_9HYPH|nr:NAD(P)/FAD-dependent oxidoreductase [Aureimonas pseudogalii]MBB3997299.1 cation diffusion facilitator CzcD-associated flavoprotein CzcO [Aureimonas pseudogalii]
MSLDPIVRDVVVIGSGLAGLTAAHALRGQGIEPLVLEREGEVGTSWNRRHPQLTLNTHRSVSSLPGSAYPAGTGAFPKRDAVIAHLQAFADRHRFEIRHGVEVLSLARTDGPFAIATKAGTLHARAVIVATGRDALPSIPPWKGIETFGGRIVHAAEFGEARAYAGRSVLVVGGGNSGFDVLNHLSRVETGPVWLSLRRSPGLLPKRLGGFAVHRLSPLMAALPTRLVDRLVGWTQRIAFGDLARHGFPPGRHDAATRLAEDHVAIAVDDGAVAAIKRGRISVVPPVVAFEAAGVILADGTRLEPEIVIAAFGYASALAPLLGPLGAIDEAGRPRLRGRLGETSVPGLWLVGMRPSLTSYFRQARREAEHAARSIARTMRV